MRRAASGRVRTWFVLLLGVFAFGVFSVWDEPSKEDKALAQRSTSFIALSYGDLPLHSNATPSVSGKTYAMRAARHGVVVFVSYGLESREEQGRLRESARQAFAHFPQLQTLSLEFYAAHQISGKARFLSRSTLSSPTKASL
jgi:hypothetical protein